MITIKTYEQAAAAPAYVERRIAEDVFIDVAWSQRRNRPMAQLKIIRSFICCVGS